MAKPNARAPLGEGGRFAALKGKLAKRPGVTNPGALAAYIGRKKYGAKKFAALSHMPKGGSLTPKGDIGELRQKEATAQGKFFKNAGGIVSASKALPYRAPKTARGR